MFPFFRPFSLFVIAGLLSGQSLAGIDAGGTDGLAVQGIDAGGVATPTGIDAGGTDGLVVQGIDAGGAATPTGIDAGGTDGLVVQGIDAGGAATPTGIDAGGTDGLVVQGIDAGGVATPTGIDAGGTDGLVVQGIDAGGVATPTGIDAGGTDGLVVQGIDAGGVATPTGIDAGGTDGLVVQGIDAGGVATPTGIDAGGTDATIIVSGPASQHNELMVGGYVLDTRDALLSRDETAISVNDILDGQIVQGYGSVLGGRFVARQVLLEPEVIGRVETVDVANNVVKVLGQSILVDSATVFAKPYASLEDVRPGSTVVIDAAVADETGRVATRIAATQLTQSVLSGEISRSSTDTHLFTIGDLTIDYAHATRIDLPGGSPTTGQKVRVTGVMDDAGQLMRAAVVTVSNSIR